MASWERCHCRLHLSLHDTYRSVSAVVILTSIETMRLSININRVKKQRSCTISLTETCNWIVNAANADVCKQLSLTLSLTETCLWIVNDANADVCKQQSRKQDLCWQVESKGSILFASTIQLREKTAVVHSFFHDPFATCQFESSNYPFYSLSRDAPNSRIE